MHMSRTRRTAPPCGEFAAASEDLQAAFHAALQHAAEISHCPPEVRGWGG